VRVHLCQLYSLPLVLEEEQFAEKDTFLNVASLLGAPLLLTVPFFLVNELNNSCPYNSVSYGHLL
jgi:hypothetical protein